MIRSKKQIKAEEERLDIGKGECGTDGWKDLLVPDKPFWLGFLSFRWACRNHDVDYAIGGREHDRIIADLDFKIMMRRECKKRFGWLWKIGIQYGKLTADTYYNAVRKYGEDYFNYEKNIYLKSITFKKKGGT